MRRRFILSDFPARGAGTKRDALAHKEKRKARAPIVVFPRKTGNAESRNLFSGKALIPRVCSVVCLGNNARSRLCRARVRQRRNNPSVATMHTVHLLDRCVYTCTAHTYTRVYV